MNHPLQNDLDDILARTRGFWDELRDGRIFMTGGTGFFGCWLLESFAWANEKLGLGASAVVLSRDPESFHRRFPRLAGLPGVQWMRGDVRSFEFPAGRFTHVIHGAAETPEQVNDSRPLLKFDTMVEGTRRVLEFARQCEVRSLLFTSSGAMYGTQPEGVPFLPEDFSAAPDPCDPRLVNGEGKRAAEMLCALYARQYGLEPRIARCFAFVGPYLPLDFPYAVGNFIRDALAGQPIVIQGDGTPQRSYLYAGDLAAWLWTILYRGKPCHPYNVGSEDAVRIDELANLVAGAVEPRVAVQVLSRPAVGRTAARYVPSTRRAREELGLQQTVGLAEAIRRTVAWHRAKRGAP